MTEKHNKTMRIECEIKCVAIYFHVKIKYLQGHRKIEGRRQRRQRYRQKEKERATERECV